MSDTIELPAPAKDGPTARVAIQYNADAVYLGAPRSGTREAAGNTISMIEEVTAFAHQYYARVYVALNTLLYDDELPAAEEMIRQLYEAGGYNDEIPPEKRARPVPGTSPSVSARADDPGG